MGLACGNLKIRYLEMRYLKNALFKVRGERFDF
jgi:hypothetical protein